ncbi:Serpentine Receptor, class AB (class A-like) [Caenorhabditis elegans]|uniref:Serpentine Receptor, class AB (Class A-like) n=1 Tax=Caenorhabditis elegans TaxID=6239 RepID=O45308_CAEEL|nr:Serpentine Receptor, class AB (class A-like) [Caenorhabditis elegans]CAB03971.1 Serpentine Receptor, class AB (class A-like) [Caenorhabditis elegans]|eukprot:NP_507492.1 Serpentine Receptor, class AB (class A-like) [Caenorhabditis elegans]
MTGSQDPLVFNCSEMLQVANSRFLRSVLYFNLFCSAVAVFYLIHTWLSICRYKLMHFNLKFLMKIHCAALLIHCVPRFFLHLFDLYYYFFGVDCYDMQPSSLRCFILRFPYMFGLILSSTTTIFLMIERGFATYYSQHYEHGYKSIGVIIAIFQLLCSLILMASVFHEYDFDAPHYYCSSISVKFPLWVIIPEVLIIVFQIAARIVNRCLLALNKRIRARSVTATLSNRYQLEANMRNIRLLQSFTLCDLIFVFTCFTLSAPVHYYSSEMERPTYHALVEVVNFVPLYSVVMPLYLWVFQKKHRDTVSNTLQASLTTSSDHYFNVLNQQLSVKEGEKRQQRKLRNR